jgi:hypothetical protein
MGAVELAGAEIALIANRYRPKKYLSGRDVEQR